MNYANLAVKFSKSIRFSDSVSIRILHSSLGELFTETNTEIDVVKINFKFYVCHPTTETLLIRSFGILSTN